MTKIDKLNELLGREIGRNTYGEPIFKWVFLPTLLHKRYNVGKDDWAKRPSGVWVPEPTFRDVQAFPHLGDRWGICKWQFVPKDTWDQIYGSRTVWPPRGYYFPTDVIMKPGFRPDMTWTEYWIGQIRLTMSKSAKEFEEKLEHDMKAEDDYQFRTMYDAILDACTAFGNKPGSRSGGVSLPSYETSIRREAGVPKEG